MFRWVFHWFFALPIFGFFSGTHWNTVDDNQPARDELIMGGAWAFDFLSPEKNLPTLRTLFFSLFWMVLLLILKRIRVMGSKIFHFNPYLGKMFNLTSILFKWVG